jgi:hypothetical protein
MAGEQGRAMVAGLVDVQARTIALDNTFVAATMLQIVAGALIWIAPRVRLRPAAGAAAAH